MSTDLRRSLTAAYADVALSDPLEQVVRRGRRIRRVRRARRVAPALAAVAAVVVGAVTLSGPDSPAGPPGPIELVGYQVPAFPLSFDHVPAGLTGPSISLDPSFERVGPGDAHASWSDQDSGIRIDVRADEPENQGDDVGDTSVKGVDATFYQEDGADELLLSWERADDQWVTVSGSGRFADRDDVEALARDVVDQPIAVPLQLAIAPRGWVVVAYKDNRILTLADPAGPPATEALARTLTVYLPQPPSDPATLPAETGAIDGRMDQVTVQGRPAYLLPVAEGWFLQATLPDGTVFVLQAPADFTEQQVLDVAEGVTH